MYPLDLPLHALRRRASPDQWVLDPFCGRGTTNFAARLLGLSSVGIDSSPIAVAIAQAKLASATAAQVIRTAEKILTHSPEIEVPEGAFWKHGYHTYTLTQVCKLRNALLKDCRSDVRKLLRAIVMGALHGPCTKFRPSHLSNQSPRTFAPKPDYAVRFWRASRMQPPKVNVLDVVRERGQRFLSEIPPVVPGRIVHGDSRARSSYGTDRFSHVITSPPYYGMRTYIPDQWLRNWFLGGPPLVQYQQSPNELTHPSPTQFAEQLKLVWIAARDHCADDAKLIVRFGAINERKADPLNLLRMSLSGTGWRIQTLRSAGDANMGKRQAKQFGKRQKNPLVEYDLYATLN
jgi:hypothetical protein